MTSSVRDPRDEPRNRQTPYFALRYLASGLSVAVALLLRLWVGDALADEVPYVQFYPAVVFATWLGGLGPGIFATMLSSVGAAYFLLAPAGWAVGGASERVSLGLFVAMALGFSWLVHRLRRAESGQRHLAATASARAERLDAIVNTSADGIIVIDSSGIIEAFNRGAERLFGYAEAEIVGRNVSVLMPSPLREAHDQYLTRYLTSGEPRIIGIGRDVTGQRRDGTLFPVQLSVGEMQIGGERKFTGMLHDLSRRASLEGQLGASEARWRAIVDSAVDGIVVIDARGSIEAFNPAAERLFGYRAAEVVGHNVTMLMPPPYREEHGRYLSRYLDTGDARVIGRGREVQGLRKDGRTFPLHLSVGEMAVSGERKFTGILHDLSDRVRMEEQLREQAALAKLGEMAAVIAHEVKNPLAGMRGAIQVFGRRLQGGTEQRILGEIVARIDALDQMMKDLLVFARPPSPRRATVEVGPLIAATTDLLSRDPAAQGVRIDLDGTAPPLEADADMLRIVFQNLLINAVHATDGRGRVRVTIEARHAACQIAVVDDGPGIPAEIRDKIFTPFFTTKSRGSGLGLPTAKRLIEAHGGQLVIESPPAGGTAVVITLPWPAREGIDGVAK
jgi:two-component system sensor kinase FixL